MTEKALFWTYAVGFMACVPLFRKIDESDPDGGGEWAPSIGCAVYWPLVLLAFSISCAVLSARTFMLTPLDSRMSKLVREKKRLEAELKYKKQFQEVEAIRRQLEEVEMQELRELTT